MMTDDEDDDAGSELYMSSNCNCKCLYYAGDMKIKQVFTETILKGVMSFWYSVLNDFQQVIKRTFQLIVILLKRRG